MIKDKMIMNDVQLDDAIQKDDEKYEYLVNKSKIRLGLFGEGNRNENDEWLKPYCIDRWRKWLEVRKQFGAILRKLKYCGNDESSVLGRAFIKWNKRVKADMERLNGMTQEQLFNLQHRGQQALKSLAEEVEEKHNEINDLKVQREYLIDKVVLGQRLALARCRFSFTFAKEKVWVKIGMNTTQSWR